MFQSKMLKVNGSDNYHAALNFCGRIINFVIGQFLCFAGTNFAIGKNWLSLLGINFNCNFQEVAFYL